MREPSSRLLALLAGDERAMKLDEAALEVASLDHAVSAQGEILRQLDAWAARARELTPGSTGGAQQLSALRRVLFQEAGLAGNREDYYAAAYSCIDSVIARRRGLPITLAVIYLEVGRRLAMPLCGVGLPGHFVCRYDDEDVRVMVDVFDGGQLLTEEDCLRIVEAAGRRISPSEELYAPASKGQIVGRMLNNLHGAYWRSGDLRRAAEVANWLRMTAPD